MKWINQAQKTFLRMVPANFFGIRLDIISWMTGSTLDIWNDCLQLINNHHEVLAREQQSILLFHLLKCREDRELIGKTSAIKVDFEQTHIRIFDGCRLREKKWSPIPPEALNEIEVLCTTLKERPVVPTILKSYLFVRAGPSDRIRLEIHMRNFLKLDVLAKPLKAKFFDEDNDIWTECTFKEPNTYKLPFLKETTIQGELIIPCGVSFAGLLTVLVIEVFGIQFDFEIDGHPGRGRRRSEYGAWNEALLSRFNQIYLNYTARDVRLGIYQLSQEHLSVHEHIKFSLAIYNDGNETAKSCVLYAAYVDGFPEDGIQLHDIPAKTKREITISHTNGTQPLFLVIEKAFPNEGQLFLTRQSIENASDVQWRWEDDQILLALSNDFLEVGIKET